MKNKYDSSVHIAIVNESTVVTTDQVRQWAIAIQQQITLHVAPIWGYRATLFTYPTKKGDVIPPNMWQCAILDDSDQAGALGYHDFTASGQPLGKVFAKTCQQAGSSVSVCMSHEIIEMLADPLLNLMTADPRTQTPTRFYAFELCDPVEDDSLGYHVGGVLVSDFVLPGWFVPASDVPAMQVDWMDRLTAPLSLATGGYMAYYVPGQGWQQPNAEAAKKHSRLTVRQKPMAARRRSTR